ncbi:MAG: DUF177 domain-containing protein [Solobacterium sp.]|nr:DUF177 domain-containing protein [Solobacterium sp.]
MEWTKAELLAGSRQVVFDEDVTVDDSEFEATSLINSVRDVHISGTGYLNTEDDRFYVDLTVSGTMLVPDAVTGEEIEVPFETDSQEVYAFEVPDEDWIRFVKDDVISLYRAVVDDILLEAPMQVTYADEDAYPEGDGWKVYSEAEYQKMKEEEIDPRLAKLMEFKEQ